MEVVTVTASYFSSNHLHKTTEKMATKQFHIYLVQAMESNQQRLEPMETKGVKEEGW